MKVSMGVRGSRQFDAPISNAEFTRKMLTGQAVGYRRGTTRGRSDSGSAEHGAARSEESCLGRTAAWCPAGGDSQAGRPRAPTSWSA